MAIERDEISLDEFIGRGKEAVKRAGLLEEAKAQMKLTLDGEGWFPELAKARYAEFVRHQPAIDQNVCFQLADLAIMLQKRAEEEEDKEAVVCFRNLAEGWAGVRVLLWKPTR